MKKHAWAVGFTACLTAFTVFLSLDTFVVSRAYQTEATEMNTDMIRQAEAAANASAKAETEKDSADSAGAETGTEEEDADSVDASSGASTDETKDSKKAGGSPASGSDSAEGGWSGASPGSGKGKRPGGKAGFRQSEGSPSVSGSEKGPSSVSGSGSRKSRKSSGGSGKSGTVSSFNEEEAAKEAAEVTTENAENKDTYQDENVTIRVTEYETNGTTIHVADVQLQSVASLKTAFAQDTYGKNVTESTSDMAASHNAILAVNGDYYGVQERGYVIRNGIVYRDQAGTSDVLCIFGDGSMKVVDPSTVTAQELADQGVWQAFSFGPGLLENGDIAVSLDTEVGRAKASNPRTAIGQIDDLHYVFVVSDGRSDESEGLSLYELATFMKQLGVQTAYNLDGGGSSTMVFQGEVINDPSGGFGDREREVSDIVYIG